MLLFYIRHGDPVYDPDGLTEKGIIQAEALVERLSSVGLDRIYSSSSNRAYMTAKPTADAVGKEIEILDWCNEAHAWRELTVRNAEGRLSWCWDYPPICEFFMSNEIRALDKKWYDHPYFSNTSFKQGILRIEDETHEFLKSLGYTYDEGRNGYIPTAHNDERIALFAHQGFGLAFLSAVLSIPYPIFSSQFDMTHTGVSVIDFSPRGDMVFPRLLQLSNDSHLFKAGVPTKYNNRIEF